MSDDFDAESERLQREHKAGSKTALMEMLFLCALHFERRMPEWAREAFIKAYQHVMAGGTRSWDDVFDRPHRKGAHIDAIWRENQKWRVHARVRELHEKEGRPIGDLLFEDVGKELGIGGSTLVGEMYSRVEHALKRVQSEPHEN